MQMYANEAVESAIRQLAARWNARASALISIICFKFQRILFVNILFDSF